MPELRMPSINQVAISGRITQDPQARQTETSPFHIAFSVAVDRPYRDAEGIWQKETTTVPVRVVDKLAEYAAERLYKGTAVFLTGRLSVSGGANTRGTALEVTARHIQFLNQEEKAEPKKDKEQEPCASSSK